MLNYSRVKPQILCISSLPALILALCSSGLLAASRSPGDLTCSWIPKGYRPSGVPQSSIGVVGKLQGNVLHSGSETWQLLCPAAPRLPSVRRATLRIHPAEGLRFSAFELNDAQGRSIARGQPISSTLQFKGESVQLRPAGYSTQQRCYEAQP